MILTRRIGADPPELHALGQPFPVLSLPQESAAPSDRSASDSREDPVKGAEIPAGGVKYLSNVLEQAE
jgi:hypothetical protein